MKIFHGLAVALYFLQTIIIQCDGAEIIKQILPDDLIGEIIAKAGLETTKGVAKAQMNVAGIAMRRIFETHIIKMSLWVNMVGNQPPVIEISGRGEMCIIIRNYTTLMLLFQHYGSHARRIHITYSSLDEQKRREINEKIINKYANQFTELQISTQDNNGIWAEMTNGKGNIRFPNVEHFIWLGRMNRSEFDLNAIFPRLKHLTLWASITDTNCLANIKNLKELSLLTGAIQEHQLENIFRNNQQINTLTFTTDPGKIIKNDILRSIENLKNLKILNLDAVGSDFFKRASNRVYNLTSVTSFKVKCLAKIEPNGNFPFDMPNLKDLQLLAMYIDGHISDFINHFEALETVLMNVFYDYDVIECIKKLKYVKEFSTTGFDKSQFSSLQQFFENFDITRSKLSKLLFLIRDQYTFYEGAMREINIKLRNSNKPTWMLSRTALDSGDYMIFERSA